MNQRIFRVFKIGIYIISVCIAVVYTSCDMLRESAFEVSAWLPGEGTRGAGEDIAISFSHHAEKTSVENAFSLTEDGNPVGGVFVWSGKTARFTPAAPLATGRDYRMALSASAKDTDGLSLEKKFEAEWTTRAAEERPRVLTAEPSGGAPVFDRSARVRIRFTQAATLLACKTGIAITPPVQGYWSLEDAGCAALFTPVELWRNGQTYKVCVSKDFESAGGRALGGEYAFSFRIGTDAAAPDICGVFAAAESGEKVFRLVRAAPEQAAFTGVVAENGRWESAYGLLFEFSERVDLARFKSRLAIEPAARFVVAENDGFAERVLVRFAEKPAYQSRYTITLNGALYDDSGNQNKDVYIYRIYIDGIYSKPPVLAGVRFPSVPKPEADGSGYMPLVYTTNELRSAADPLAAGSYPYFFDIRGDDAHYPYGSEIDTWLELYFDSASGAGIDLISVREKFRIETTNNCLAFSPYAVIDSGFSSPLAAAEFAAYRRVEVRGTLHNINRRGLVTLYLGGGLSDSMGNTNAQIQRIELYK